MKAAEKVAWLCRERGLTQKRVGELARLPLNRISKWLDGQGEPTARQALRLSRILSVPLDWLIDDDQEVPPPPIELSPQEQRAVEMVRALGLDLGEVYRRLSGEKAGEKRKGADQSATAPTPSVPRHLGGSVVLDEYSSRRVAEELARRRRDAEDADQ